MVRGLTFARRRRHAFTLVEMLVVIAIIITLAAILLPAVLRARDAARTVTCVNNLHQIGIAGLRYYDVNGYYPPYRLEDPNIAQQFAVQRPGWQWIISPFIGEPPQDPDALPTYEATDPTALNAPLTCKTFLCPNLTDTSTDFGANGNGAPIFASIRSGAYGYNFAYLGNSRVLSDNNKSATAGDPYLNFPVRGVSDPARTVMFGDSRGGGIPHGQHSKTLDGPHQRVSTMAPGAVYGSGSPLVIKGFDPYGPDEGTAAGIQIPFSPAEARHNGRANIVFCDGHVETLALSDLGYTQFDSAGNPLPQSGPITFLQWGDNRLWTGRGIDDQSPNYGAVQNLTSPSPIIP